MTNNSAPRLTKLPSVNATLSIYPVTRGRISTVSTACSLPVNSSQSFTRFSMTGATLTSGGTAAGGPPLAQPPRVSAAHAARLAACKLLILITCELLSPENSSIHSSPPHGHHIKQECPKY